MINATAGYIARMEAGSKTPVYGVIITPSGFASEPRYDFISAGRIGAPKLLTPLSLHREVDPAHSRFGSLSTLRFRLSDIDGEVTPIVSDLIGYEVQLEMEYWDWEVANVVIIFMGIITNIELEDRSYLFTARSKFAAAHDKIIFNGSTTRLIDAVDDDDQTFHVEDASDFEGAAFGPGEAEPFQVGPRHIYTYRGIEEVGDGTWNLTSVIRSAGFGYFVPPELPDLPESHNPNSMVKNIIQLGVLSAATSLTGGNDGSLHPIQMLLAILTTNTGKKGIAESAITVNATELVDAFNALGANLQFRFVFSEGVSVKKFLEQEIYLPLAAYPTETHRGAIGIKLFDDATASVDTITDADIVQRATWEGNADKRVNTVIYKYDYVPTTREYTSTYVYRDEGLIQIAGREIPLIIESKGIRSPLIVGASQWFTETPAFLEAAAKRHIARFGLSAPVISVRTMWDKHLLEVADPVTVTFADVVNPMAGTIGLEGAPAEIISMHINFVANVIDMKLLGVAPLFVSTLDETEYIADTGEGVVVS